MLMPQNGVRNGVTLTLHFWRENKLAASICLGEYYQSSLYLEHLFIARLDNGVYETLATTRYPQKNVRVQSNFTLCVWPPYY